jgi:hypothetical protein
VFTDDEQTFSMQLMLDGGWTAEASCSLGGFGVAAFDTIRI